MFLQLILILVVLIPLLAIVLDSQVGRALASRLERRSLDGPGDLTAERIAFLEGEVERLASELQRLDEESEFVQKLLTERAQEQGATLPPGDERA
ncbi:MAG TPA: hypothetical protein VM198_00895 [Longimicrobiales bacterium]|jgi:uncharacterized small protein (DUF1192 family)|nr:hypothetical protein [Longimicrobiales bacterium]